MPKRKASAADSGHSTRRKKAPTTNCPVCFEDVEDDKLDLFPCGHSTCTLCGTRCDKCPICRMGRDGRSDEERRDAEARFEALTGAHVTVTQIPPHRIAEFVGGDGSTPFSGLSVHTSGLTGPMNEVIGMVVVEVMNRHARTNGRPLSRGELQQAMSTAMVSVVPPTAPNAPNLSNAPRNGRGRAGSGRAGRSLGPVDFVVRDVLGRPIELDADETDEDHALASQ